MRARRAAVTAAFLLMAGPGLCGASGARAATPEPCPTTEFAALPPAPLGEVNDIAPISNSDVWASASSHGLAHWDGSSWSYRSTPSYYQPLAVTAVGPRDVWAVGGAEPGHASTLHYDGRSWRPVPAEDLGGDYPPGFFVAASAGPSSVWAGGGVIVDNKSVAALQHWTGTAWRQADLPVLPSGRKMAIINGLSVLSATNVWAIGDARVSGSGEWAVLHFDGVRWSVALDRNNGGVSRAVHATPGGDVLALFTSGHKGRSLHFDGTAWREIPVPQPSAGVDSFSLAGTASGVRIAVGSISQDAADGEHARPYAQRFDGSRWTPVPITGVHSARSLQSVALAPSGRFWAGGPDGVVVASRCAAPAPHLFWGEPFGVAPASSGVPVRFVGTGLRAGAMVRISGPDISVGRPTVTSPTALTAPVTVRAGAQAGLRDVTVINPDGSRSTCSGCLAIVAGSGAAR